MKKAQTIDMAAANTATLIPVLDATFFMSGSS
jgi:hypothetical protein